MTWKDLSASEARALLTTDPNVLVLDVRTPPEYESHHIEGASLIPVQVLDRYFQQLDKSRAWLVVCEHGRRSVAACGFLSQQGFSDLRNLSGGMEAWLAEGLPIGKGLPQAAQPGPAAAKAGGGGCGHSCGCAGQQPAQDQERQGASQPAKRGWLRSILGR